MNTLGKWLGIALIFLLVSTIGVYNSVESSKSYHNTLKKLEYVAEDLFKTHEETHQLFTTVAGVRVGYYGRYNPTNPKKDVLINDDSLTYYVNDHKFVYTVTFYDMKLIDYGKLASSIYLIVFLLSISFMLISSVIIAVKSMLDRKKTSGVIGKEMVDTGC